MQTSVSSLLRRHEGSVRNPQRFIMSSQMPLSMSSSSEPNGRAIVLLSGGLRVADRGSWGK